MAKYQTGESNISFICKSVIWLGALAVLLTPLLYNTGMYYPFVSIKGFYLYAVVQIMLAAWLVLAVYEGRFLPKRNTVLIAFGIFIAAIFVSALAGIDFERSFWSQYDRFGGLLTWFHMGALFLVISSFFTEKSQWLKLFSFSTIIASVIALVALLDILGVEIIAESRGGSTLGNTSYLGVYLLFNLFLSAYTFFSFKDPTWKGFSASAFGIILITLLLGSAKAAMIASVGGLFLALCLYILLSYSSKKPLKIAAGSLIVAGILGTSVASFLLFQEGSPVNEWFVGHANQARFVVWEGAWQGFLEKPVLGWGPENYDSIHTRHFNPCLFVSECGREIWFDRAHNIVLDALSTTGVVGFLAYMFLIVSLPLVLWRAFLRDREGQVDLFAVSIFTGMIAAYFVQNLTFFDVIPGQLLLVFALGFGAFLVSSGGEKRLDVSMINFRIRRVVSVAIASGLVLSLLYFVFLPARSGLYAVYSVQIRSAIPEKVMAFEGAMSAPMGNHEILRRLAKQTSDFARERERWHEGLSVDQLLEQMEFLTEELEKVVERNPYDFHSRLRLTELHNSYILLTSDDSRVPVAQESAEELIRIAPNHPKSYREMTQVEIFQGNIDEAIELAEKAVELEPRFLNFHLFAINIYENLLGDEEGARSAIIRAVEVDPEWKEVFDIDFED